MAKRLREQWMVAAEVPQTSIFFMSVPTTFMLWRWPKAGLGNFLTKYFSFFESDFAKMYFLRSEFDVGSSFLAQKMLRRPEWALTWIDKVEKWTIQFMRASKLILRSPLRDMTDRQLIRLLRTCAKLHGLQNGFGASISWMADAEKERVTKGIWAEVARQMHTQASSRDVADVFSVLTTPRRESFVAKEEKDFFHIGSTIVDKPLLRSLFRKTPASEILQKLKRPNKKLYTRILRHHRKYCWLNYQYRGPATPMTEYLERWQELARSKRHPTKMLNEITLNRQRTLSDQKNLLRELTFDSHTRKLITLAQRLVFIKGFRKEAVYHGMYAYDPLLREIGRRLGLTIAQLWAMRSEEVAIALLKKIHDIDQLNERQRRAISYIDTRHETILTGKHVQVFLKKIRIEKTINVNAKELRGTPACSGIVRGTVKVINIPEDMSKMRIGDILVAHNTNPNLVPAMKKAAALVSESGGLTCHTAIVARELRTPCVVGVPGAHKILKDGDRVEVDAVKGIIRKL